MDLDGDKPPLEINLPNAGLQHKLFKLGLKPIPHGNRVEIGEKDIGGNSGHIRLLRCFIG